MLHNSLPIRDRLRAANLDPKVRGRRAPHRPLAFDGAVTPEEGDVALTGAWRLATAGNLPGLAAAADDLRAFLVGCGLTLSETADREIVLAAADDAPPAGFRLMVEADRVTIEAASAAGLWAGVVDLERSIALRRAAILRRGTIERRPAWPVQISQAPYGANYLIPDLSADYLSDDAFRLLTQFGVTGMTIYGDWLLYIRNERYPELTHPEQEHHVATLRDATERAGQFGVRLYFVPVSPKLPADHALFRREPTLRGSRIVTGLEGRDRAPHNLCSSSAEGLWLHGETFAALFRDVPDLGGLILIVGGESYYHCFTRPDKTGRPEGEQTNCPRCARHSPEEVVAGLLAATADGVRRVAPDRPVMAWPYSAFVWSGDPDQLALIGRLPAGVALLTEIDKDAWAPKDGYEKHIWDYSVDFTGPSDRITRQAAAVRQRDGRLFVKTETALGLECIQVPYVPALPRLGTKWARVRELAPAGVLQSWMFFGMWGSPAEELGWWANWRADVPLDDALRSMAERDFGARADSVLAAWHAMSEAVGHLPYIPTYFHGPEFIGPCHPLLFDRDEPVPDLFHAALYYLQENEATFATVAQEVRHSLVTAELPARFVGRHLRAPAGANVWAIVFAEYAAAAAAAERAFGLLRATADEVDAGPETPLGEQRGLVEFLGRSWRCAEHTLRFLVARQRWEGTHRPRDRDEMIAVARAELLNARGARHLFTDHPWLNLKLRRDGDFPDSLVMLDAKIALLELSLGAEADAGARPATTDRGGDGG